MTNNMKSEVEKNIINKLQQALQKTAIGENIELSSEQLAKVEVEVPREKSHGDYASNIAMVMAGKFQQPPRELAQKLIDNFNCNLIEDISIDGPGFINFTLTQEWLYNNLNLILEKGEDYGKLEWGQDKKVQIEFVSANPTGPLHVGHSRGAVTGDVLANILKTAGYKVDKEYYINNAGNQMDILGESTLIRYQQLCGENVNLPADSYAGDYIKNIAQKLKKKYGTKILEKNQAEQVRICQNFAYEKMLKRIKNDLKDYEIIFDNWFSEKKLHQGQDKNEIEKALDFLKNEGYIYEKEDALWFKASEFGDDKDRVVIKSDGAYTYLAADIAYHYNKLNRGYDQLINIWGADHHGYIPRVKASIEAFGYDQDKLEVIIVQMVTLLRDGKKVSMSKRSGNFVTMSDVLQEVGKDAARYFYIMRSTDSHLDFDLDLAKEESSNNPVYYIQYAHARIQSILENIEKLPSSIDLSLLDSESEIDLMKMLANYPEEIKISAQNRQPHHLANYAYELAGAFHQFYNKCRVIIDNKELQAARLYLVRATRQVLRNVLSLLGLDAPDQM